MEGKERNEWDGEGWLNLSTKQMVNTKVLFELREAALKV